MKIRVNTKAAFEVSHRYVDENLSKANAAWEALLKDVMTLSSTILVLSVSFRKEGLSFWNYLDWGLLFLSIFLGIVCRAETACLFDRLAKKELNEKLISLNDFLVKGEHECELESNGPGIEGGNPLIGVFSIIAFLFGAFGLLVKIIGPALHCNLCVYSVSYLVFSISISAIIYKFRAAIFLK